MRVLIACEFSGTVRDAFRIRGHEAWSCDLLPCDSVDEWHIQGDVLSWLGDGWDLLIAHPPCTYLTYAANGVPNTHDRKILRAHAERFFMRFADAPVPRICIENPVGWMNSVYRSPDQIIQPYHFGDPVVKRTCLWLKGLPLLIPRNPVARPEPMRRRTTGLHPGKAEYFTDASPFLDRANRAHDRSRTFQGIADAMAEQWGAYDVTGDCDTAQRSSQATGA